MKGRAPVQLTLDRAFREAWMRDDVWTYMRGLPDRDAAPYAHLIRAPFDGVETMARGATERSLGGEADRKKKGGTAETWATQIVALLEDGRPRTFNTICVELVGTTADVLFDEPIDHGLWLACERLDIAWTVESPIFWTLSRLVSWDNDEPDTVDDDEARADASRA